jgi:hypothetical protein
MVRSGGRIRRETARVLRAECNDLDRVCGSTSTSASSQESWSSKFAEAFAAPLPSERAGNSTFAPNSVGQCSCVRSAGDPQKPVENSSEGVYEELSPVNARVAPRLPSRSGPKAAGAAYQARHLYHHS